MEDKFFLTQVQHKNDAWAKGVVVKDTLDAARQSFHAYLGAYAYGQDPSVDYVLVQIVRSDGVATDGCVWDNRVMPEEVEE